MNRVKFSELPKESQLALFEYCAHFAENMENVEDFYKNTLFSLEEITPEEAGRRCMEGYTYGYKTFEEYHQAYTLIPVPDHGDSVYPVIDGGMEEWLDDGWHRFHSYIKYYPERMIPVLTIEFNALAK